MFGGILTYAIKRGYTKITTDSEIESVYQEHGKEGVLIQLMEGHKDGEYTSTQVIKYAEKYDLDTLRE